LRGGGWVGRHSSSTVKRSVVGTTSVRTVKGPRKSKRLRKPDTPPAKHRKSAASKSPKPKRAVLREKGGGEEKVEEKNAAKENPYWQSTAKKFWKKWGNLWTSGSR